MTLAECTKDELIWLIKRIEKREYMTAKAAVAQALIDLEFERQQRRFREADSAMAKAFKVIEQYNALMAPYAGRNLADIPLPILEKAAAFVEERDKQWAIADKLMGIKGPNKN